MVVAHNQKMIVSILYLYNYKQYWAPTQVSGFLISLNNEKNNFYYYV